MQPALVEGGNQSRAKELIDVTATDSQSFLAVIHNTSHLDRTRRPPAASPATRIAHWTIGGMLTVLTLMVASWPRPSRVSLNRGNAITHESNAVDALLLLGALVVLMALLSPVCHLHYFALSIPLALGLVAASWHRRPAGAEGIEIGMALRMLFAFNFIANVLPKLPGLELSRDLGSAMYAALTLWLTACIVLSRRRRPPVQVALARAA